VDELRKADIRRIARGRTNLPEQHWRPSIFFSSHIPSLALILFTSECIGSVTSAYALPIHVYSVPSECRFTIQGPRQFSIVNVVCLGTEAGTRMSLDYRRKIDEGK